MANKIVPLVLIAVLSILGAVIYFNYDKASEKITEWSQQAPMPLEVQNLSTEISGVSQDLSDLEEMNNATGLENLDKDLAMVSGEEGLADISSITDMETEISMDLEGFSSDISDLSAMGNDASLNNLDTALSGMSQ